MGITFPRTMPVDFASDQRFEVQRVDYLSPEASGRIGGIQAGFPLWVGLWTLSSALGRAKAEELRAWITSMDGPTRLFYGRDFSRPYPLAYPNGFSGLTRHGGGAFDGTATSWSIDTPGEVVTLNGQPDNFPITAGDYVGFSWVTSSQPRRSLHRFVETVTGSSSGIVVGTVRPAVPSIVPGGATATLAQPDCLMKLIPDQTKIDAMSRRLAVGGQIAAIQQLLS